MSTKYRIIPVKVWDNKLSKRDSLTGSDRPMWMHFKDWKTIPVTYEPQYEKAIWYFMERPVKVTSVWSWRTLI